MWLATKFAAPHLRRSPRGPNIVNAASVSGLTGFPLGPIYCTSKGGVVQLTRVTAVDLAPTVRCNCFCPGVIATPLARGHVEAAEDLALLAAEHRFPFYAAAADIYRGWVLAEHEIPRGLRA